MVFGPARSRPSCAISLSGHLAGSRRILPLPWCCAHSLLAVGRTCRPHSRPWPSTLCTKYLVGPIRRPTCFFLGLPALHVCSSQRHFRNGVRWRLHSHSGAAGPRPATVGPHLLGWASGTPCASVLYELALPDSLRLSTGRALPLFGRLHSFTSGARVPLPAAVFALSQNTPGTWAHWCLSLLQHHAAGNPADFGVGPRCSSAVTRRWLHRVVNPLLDRAWFHRLRRGLALLSGIRFNPGAVRPYALDHMVYNSTVDPGLARWWGLARHGHDPCPGGRTARHRGDVSQCAFCSSASGDFAHCLAICPAFSDLRLRWCAAVRVVPAEAAVWARHPWLFTPGHPGNSHGTVRGHVQFVGQVCARVHDHR